MAILDELVAIVGFEVQGLEKLKRAVAMFARFQKAILAVAAAVTKRLGRVASVLVRTTAAAAAFGAGFVASSAVITGAAGAIVVALGAVAAGFARMRKAMIDQAFVKGIPVRELDLVQKLMLRIGASAKDGQKWLSEFVDKVREGQKEGGDWADTLAKQGVNLKGARGRAKSYSAVIDEILRASDKIADPEKKRSFLVESLPGAPDELLSQLLQSTSALEKWRKLVTETRKTGGNISFGDVLNAGDITDALGKVAVAMRGFGEAIGSGLMKSFASDFRALGNAISAIATDENRARLSNLASGIAEFAKDVVKGGLAVLGQAKDVISSITGALGAVDEATGGRLGQIAKGLFLLGAALALVAAGPAVAISAAITGLLFAVAKFQEWKDGGTNALSGFFDTIAKSANDAKAAVEGLLATLRQVFSFGSGGAESDIQSGNEFSENFRDLRQKDADRQKQKREQSRDRAREQFPTPSWLEMLKGLFRKSAEMSPEHQTQKMAGDKAAAADNRRYENIGNDQRQISVTTHVTTSDQSSIAGKINQGVLGAISSKGANTSTGVVTQP